MKVLVVKRTLTRWTRGLASHSAMFCSKISKPYFYTWKILETVQNYIIGHFFQKSVSKRTSPQLTVFVEIFLGILGVVHFSFVRTHIPYIRHSSSFRFKKCCVGSVKTTPAKELRRAICDAFMRGSMVIQPCTTH